MHRPSLTSFFAWKPTAFHICIRKYMVCQGFSRNERFVQRQSVRPHKLNNPNLFQQPKQVSKLHRQPSSIVGSSGPMDRAHRSHRWGTGSGPVATTTLRRRLWISHSGAKTWDTPVNNRGQAADKVRGAGGSSPCRGLGQSPKALCRSIFRERCERPKDARNAALSKTMGFSTV